MASNFTLSTGTTPQKDQGIWFLWVKILMRTQEVMGGGNPDNDPRRDDPLRTLRVKVDRALNGL